MNRSFTRIRALVCVVLALTLLLCLCLPAALAVNASLNPGGLLYAGPGSAYAVAYEGKGGETISVGNNAGSSWYPVSYQDRDYWAKADSFTLVGTVQQSSKPSVEVETETPVQTKPTVEAANPDSAQTNADVLVGTVRAQTLNVRANAGTNYRVVGKLGYGNKVEIVARNADSSWYKINAGSVTGWVSADYIRVGQNQTTQGVSLPDGYSTVNSAGVYQPITGESKYLVLINKDTQVGAVLEKDATGYYTAVVRTFVVSTGRYGRTPTGVFTISDVHRWHLMIGGSFTQYAMRINGGIMLHSVTYRRTDPSTLYTNAYNDLGSAVSAGCIRMRVEDCKWIYDNCGSGTVVQVINSGTYPGIPDSIAVDDLPAGVTWDPTDPDENNPVYGEYK